MNLTPDNQTSLYGLDYELLELISLYKNNKLPNKILLSGQKGVGKCTLAYHLINYILSQGEENSYYIEKYEINKNNKSFRLIQNRINPNFTLIDVLLEKKKIDISQIRNLITDLNKSSFNLKPRFVLVDNIEFLNINSINALLKILEEPSQDIHFILIHNNKKILPTLKSRCLNYQIFLTHEKSVNVCEKLLSSNIHDLINKDLLDYYFTPGKIYNLINFAKANNIDLKKIELKEFLSLIIDNSYYKKENTLIPIFFNFIEFFLTKKKELIYSDFSNYFLKKIDNTKKFHLDEETLFIEFKNKVLNG